MYFLNALPGAVAEGLIWGLVAIGVYISYKMLDIADLSVDGSICTGACVCAVLIAAGLPAWLCVFAALGHNAAEFSHTAGHWSVFRCIFGVWGSGV